MVLLARWFLFVGLALARKPRNVLRAGRVIPPCGGEGYESRRDFRVGGDSSSCAGKRGGGEFCLIIRNRLL